MLRYVRAGRYGLAVLDESADFVPGVPPILRQKVPDLVLPVMLAAPTLPL
jgi:hypothetical protein